MHRIAFTSVTFRNLTREEVCAVAKKNGVKYIEWGADVHLPSDDGKALAEVTALQEKYGLHAVSYGSYYKVGQDDFAGFGKILNVCEKIGAERVRLWLGEKSSAKTEKSLLLRLAEETKVLCDMAQSRNITVSFEFHEGTFNDCGKAFAEFLNAVGKENLATYWQPLRTKEDFLNLQTVAPFVNGVHVFNWGVLGARHSLESGKKDWIKYIKYLEENSGNTDYILEFVKGDSPEQFAEDVKTLKRILCGDDFNE